jgi:hypothetical protein
MGMLIEGLGVPCTIICNNKEDLFVFSLHRKICLRVQRKDLPTCVEKKPFQE